MKKLIISFLVPAMAICLLQSCKGTGDKKEKAGAEPVLLSSLSNKASCVFLAADEKNKPVISWVETDPAGKTHFFFARMDTATGRFLTPEPIPIEEHANIHEEGMPKIAVKGDGTLLAIYETSTPVEGSRWGLGDIRYIQSSDQGKTWTSPRSVSPDIKEGLSASFSDLIRLGDGEIGISWLGTNPGKQDRMARPVLFAKTNGKEGFGKEILITPQACQCCRTALGSDKDGEISLAFRDLLPGEVRDISVSTSSDDGVTFSNAVSFSGDDWVVDGCPHNGPSVSVREGKTYTAWFTGGDRGGVYYAELDSIKKMTFRKYISPDGRFVQLCLMPDGSRIVVYNADDRKGDSIYSKIMVNKVDDSGFFSEKITPDDCREASYPVVRPAGNDKAVVAWSGMGRVYYRLINTHNIIKPAERFEPVKWEPGEGLPFSRLSSNVDPVCGMTLTASNIGDTTLSQGKIVGFCSGHCKREFLGHH